MSEVIISLIIQYDNKPDEQIEIGMNPYTTISEIMGFVNVNLKLNGDSQHWTCFSHEEQRFLSLNDCIGEQKKQTLIIDVSNNVKIQPPNQQEMQFCRLHTRSPIQFICIENHYCQRRLCAECQHDQMHNSLSISQFVPLEHFKMKIIKQAQESLNKKNNCHILKNGLKKIFFKIEKLISQQEKSYQDEISNYYDSFQMATELLKSLEQPQILNNSNSILEEMVLIYQQNELQKQAIINNVNLKTIEENIKKFDSIVDSFLQQISNLQFNIIPLHECSVNYESEKIQITYQGINLCQISPSNEVYGKNIISQSNVKVEIFNNFQSIQFFSIEIQPKTTLRQLGGFVQECIKNQQYLNRVMPADFQEWTYYSEEKKKYLEDFDKILYNFFVQDHIKIYFAQQILVQQQVIDSKINLKINIKDENVLKVLRVSLSQQCTIEDLENCVAILWNFQRNQKDILIYIIICDKMYRNEIKRQKTLFQLQIKPYTGIEAILQRNQEKIKPFTILLLFEIQDRENKVRFSQKFKINETLFDVQRAMMEFCNLNVEHSTIDFKILGINYNTSNIKRVTLNQLGLKINTRVQGEIIWI